MLQICAEHAAKPKKKTDTAAASATPAADGEDATAAPAPDAEGDVNMDSSDSAPATGSTAPAADGTATAGAAAAATESLSDLVASQANSAPAGDDEAEGDGEVKALKHQAVAVIGIALIAMGEDVGAEMALRQFQHLVS